MSIISKTVVALVVLQTIACVSKRQEHPLDGTYTTCDEFKRRNAKYLKLQHDDAALLDFFKPGDFVYSGNGIELGYILSIPYGEDEKYYEIRILEGNTPNGKGRTVRSERPRFLDVLNAKNNFYYLIELRMLYKVLKEEYDDEKEFKHSRPTERFGEKYKWIFNFSSTMWRKTQACLESKKNKDFMVGDYVQGLDTDFNGNYVHRNGFIEEITEAAEMYGDYANVLGNRTVYRIMTSCGISYTTTALFHAVPDARQYDASKSRPKKYHHSCLLSGCTGVIRPTLEKARNQFRRQYRFCADNY